MKKYLLVLMLGFAANMSYAQSYNTLFMPDSTIQYSRHGFFRTGRFTVNGHQETKDQIFTRLMNNPASAGEFNEYKRYRNLTEYMALGVGLSLLAAAIANGNASTFKNTSSKVLAGVAFGFIIPEAIFAGKRNKHYRRSFELYNQQYQ